MLLKRLAQFRKLKEIVRFSKISEGLPLLYREHQIIASPSGSAWSSRRKSDRRDWAELSTSSSCGARGLPKAPPAIVADSLAERSNSEILTKHYCLRVLGPLALDEAIV